MIRSPTLARLPSANSTFQRGVVPQARDYIGAKAFGDLVALTIEVVERLPTGPDAAS